MIAPWHDDASVCLVTGVGPGTGAAIARRFAAGGHRVAMLARDAARLAALEDELPGSRAFPCDVGDTAALTAVLDEVRRTVGEPAVVVHNAVSGSFGTF
jgi:NAD(P)-dependent dehydrogenase (short-subunit alcohol dehydrogenase family)